MRAPILLLIGIATLAIGGCVTPIPLRTAALDWQPTIVSTKEATLRHHTGTIRTGTITNVIIAGPIIVPYTLDGNRSGNFDEVTQAEFMELLRDELVRLGVLRAVRFGEDLGSSDVLITVDFADSYYAANRQIHELDVVLSIEGGKAPFRQTYKINSVEKLTRWERLNTNGYQSKVLAARALLEALIPDIRAYVAQDV